MSRRKGLAWTMGVWAAGLLAATPGFAIRSSTAKVELRCLVQEESGGGNQGPLWVEVQTPAGLVVRQAARNAGAAVTFKGLDPGIFVVCVRDGLGERSCLSVDLYPASESTKAHFTTRLTAPSWSPGSGNRNLVTPADLVVPDRARQELRNCLKEQSRGDFSKAASHLDRALAVWPDYAEALINRGTLAYQAGEYALAKELFERATASSPELHSGWINLGSIYYETGDVRRALQATERALSLRPHDPMALYQMGLCHYKLGDFASAKRFLERVVELDPVSATFPHLCLAGIAMREKRPDEAERLLQEHFRLHPYTPRPRVVRQLLDRLSATRASQLKGRKQ